MRSEHITSKLEQLLALSINITDFYDVFIGIGLLNTSNQHIQTQLSELKGIWNQFHLVHTAVTISIPKLSVEEQREILNHFYFKESIYDTTREVYLNSFERFTSLLEHAQSATTEVSSIQSTSVPSTSNQSASVPTTSNQLASVPSAVHHSTAVSATSNQSVPLPSAGFNYLQNAKLPFIKIPHFDGNSDKWLAFKNLFHSMIVTSQTLSAVEKLQYLKTHLEGTALNLVQHTALTAENFQKTWDALVEFYENTRLLINSTLQSLFNLKRVNKESGSELQQLYSDIMQLYRTFETLGCPVAHWDHILIFICTQKLDLESNKVWESQLGSSRKPPSWKQFHDFLFARMSSLQSFESSQQKRILQSTKQFSAKVHHQGKPNDKGACILCKERHFISFCPQYASKTIQQKLTFISTHKLCYNCLGSHRVAHCRVTKRCQKCGLKHHTSIHSNESSKFKGKENNNNTKQESLEENLTLL
ncbi:uncharacterized protein [Temnothorax longispinosus]|uniref:uncharacterized protein n=1 Tax=Temnothorax longispinosus TaxID=300112 RepID=UPI003A99AAD9